MVAGLLVSKKGFNPGSLTLEPQHFIPTLYYLWLPRWHSGKESAFQCRRHRRHGFDPWVIKIHQSRKWQNPLQYSCLEKSHGQKSLAGYSSWGHQELDTAECVCTHGHTQTHSGSIPYRIPVNDTEMGRVEQVTCVLAPVTSLRPFSRKFCYFVSNPCLSIQENITEQVSAFR